MNVVSRGFSTVAIKLMVVAVAAAAIFGVGYYLMKSGEVKPSGLRELPAVVADQSAVGQASQKMVEKPIYEEPVIEPSPEPLPPLTESDDAVMAAVQNLNVDGLVPMLVSKEVVRKFVRAIDAVEEGKLITEYRPIDSPKGSLEVDSFQVSVASGELGETQNVEQFRMSKKNYSRYDRYVSVVTMLNTDAAVAFYKHFYPLANEAYKEMGSTKGNFHSVLIRAIDTVLAAPDVRGNMMLIRPKVYYQFADPALEKLPEIQKLMLRMGPENSQIVKTNLKSLRAKLLKNNRQ